VSRFIVSLTLAIPFMTACAAAPPPSERMALAESAVRAAQEVGAERVPTAELHVRLAEDEIQKAKALSNNDQNERADTMLQRASADAELALALAREEGTRSEAERALKQTQDLKTNRTQ
jgi:hypothetical protein